MAKSFLESSYKRAKRVEDLPWYRDYTPRFLAEALQQSETPARALDVGCGTGTYSVIMAQSGYDVTGVDFVEAALEMARERAQAAEVHVTLEHADVCAYQTQDAFDLVLDSGCLHSLSDKQRYLENLRSWLKPGGHFILVHFNKRHFFDWRPMGPDRWKRAQIEDFLGPEFQLLNDHDEIGKVPFPVGPTALISTYWFQRTQK